MRYMLAVHGPDDAIDTIGGALEFIGEPLYLLDGVWLLDSHATSSAELHASLRALLNEDAWITIACVDEVVSDVPPTIPIPQWLERHPT